MPKTGSVVRMNNIRRTYVVTYITTYNLYGMILDSTRYEEGTLHVNVETN